MTTDTRTALMDHAEHFVRARGFDGFSYADLAEAVGIRKASVHYHFATKAGLSMALIERYTRTMAQSLSAIEADNAAAADRLRGLVGLYRDALNDGQTLCLCVSLSASRQSLGADVVGAIAGFRSMMISWLSAVFALGQSDGSVAGVTQPDQEARAGLALLEGAHLAARAEGDVEIFDRALALLTARC